MYPLLLLLILVLVLAAKGFLKKEINKVIQLLKSITLFALVFGFLGGVLGLIGAFDTMDAVGKVSTEIFAARLKISFLSPAFGMLVFLVGRLAIILLIWLRKD